MTVGRVTYRIMRFRSSRFSLSNQNSIRKESGGIANEQGLVFSFDTYRKASNDITCQAVYDWAEPGSTPTVTTLIREFLRRVQVLPWDEGVAQTYVDLRAACTLNGTTLSASVIRSQLKSS